MTRQAPLVLAILDGWGIASPSPGNAIAGAKTPEWDRLNARATATTLSASGEEVGLPRGVMGNSEVGHLNIGSGRVVPQGIVLINESIKDGSFSQNPALRRALEHVREREGRIHFMGLLSDGEVHSSIAHLEALIAVAVAGEVPFVLDLFSDGRDVPPSSLPTYLERIEQYCAAFGKHDVTASLSGRFYAMDRDRRWERTESAYDTLIGARPAHRAATAQEALEAATARGESDEFITPTQVGEPRPIGEGDAVIFFNFRPDRARQMTSAFTRSDFADFPVKRFESLNFTTMTRYDEAFTTPILFGPRPQYDTFGDTLARAGLTQLRLAETEKYAHVTYFFNGGREDMLSGEDRKLIPSDRSVATYDLAPEMQAAAITDYALADIAARGHDVIVINYANADMVGHTGKLEATIRSIEALDRELGRLHDAVLAVGGILAITADHGNAEEKLDPRGNALTAHTTNPVPFLIAANEPLSALCSGGKLGDIAPTLLPLLGLAVPESMTGANLLLSPAR
jgi:2,3-bisphosphoglycerate-independent phosphoglycerate mutase